MARGFKNFYAGGTPQTTQSLMYLGIYIHTKSTRTQSMGITLLSLSSFTILSFFFFFYHLQIILIISVVGIELTARSTHAWAGMTYSSLLVKQSNSKKIVQIANPIFPASKANFIPFPLFFFGHFLFLNNRRENCLGPSQRLCGPLELG